MLGAVMLKWGWGFAQIFLALAVPMAIGALAIAIMGNRADEKPTMRRAFDQRAGMS
jgi:hypothetical protein